MHPLTGRVFPKEMSREVSSRRGFGGDNHSIAAIGCGPGISKLPRLGFGRWPLARGLPWLGILAGRNDSMGIPPSNRVVAFARIASPVSGDRPNVLIGRNLLQQLRQHGRIRPHSSFGNQTPLQARRAFEQFEGSAPGALAQTETQDYQN